MNRRVFPKFGSKEYWISEALDSTINYLYDSPVLLQMSYSEHGGQSSCNQGPVSI